MTADSFLSMCEASSFPERPMKSLAPRLSKCCAAPPDPLFEGNCSECGGETTFKTLDEWDAEYNGDDVQSGPDAWEGGFAANH